MSDRAYTSRKAMTDAASRVAGHHGAPLVLGIERAQTDTPIYRVVSPAGGREDLLSGVHTEFSGSAREIRAYLRGIADAHYWSERP